MTIKRIAIVMSVLLLCIGKLSAQWATCYQPLSASKVLDTASYEVLYQVQMRWGKRIITDTVSLLIGKKYTQTYNPRLKRMRLQTDSLFNLDQDAPSVYFLTFPEDTYYNLETGQITAVYRSFEPGPPLKYKEPTPKFNWVTSARDSTVLSYPCSEAQMSFRGRDYRALFTMNIRKDIRKYVERMHKKPKTYMRIVTNGMVMFRDGDEDNVSFPYNPIELE